MASMDTIYQGAAIFSTHLGKFEPRNTVPPSIILRTNPNDDQDEMVARLQRTFPQECKLIKAPITNVAYYFDGYEMHQYGYCFLQSVLETIARHNWNRAQNVQGFADQWMKANPEHFDRIMSMSYRSFSETARHTHGEDFGREVFGLLQSKKAFGPAATGPQAHQPTYQSQPYGATSRSSFGHATFQPGSNPNKSQENTVSSHRRTHESSPQSSSSHATLQPGLIPKKSRVNTSSYPSHANGISPESSSSRATLQSGSDPKKSQANTSSSQSPENGSSSNSPSSHVALQSGSNRGKFRPSNSSQSHANKNSSKFSVNYGAARSGPNQSKSRVTNGSSRTYANGTLPNNTHGSVQIHTHGASQGFAYGPSQGFAHGTSQSHEYRGSQTYAQGSYQQQPSDFVAFLPDTYGRPPVIQNFQYGSRRLPVRGHNPPLRGYFSDPEFYIQRHQTQYVGPVIVDSSPEQESPLMYHYPSPPTSQDHITVPNPLKTVTDDARVLEMQEAAERRSLNDSIKLGDTLDQPSETAIGKLPDPELHVSALPGSNSHICCEQPANDLLDRDPAVISVGSKPDHALDQSDHRSADVHQSPQDEQGGFLASLMQKNQSLAQQPSTPRVSEIIEADSLAGLHDANAHQMHHQSKNVKTPPDTREPPTHGTQSESTESSGHRQELFDRKMTSNGQKHAIDQSQPIHRKFKSSNTRSTSFQGDHHRNRSDTSNSNSKYTVWVGGLNPKITEAKLMEIFGPYGEITKISKVFTREGETPWAFAFVTFLTEEAAHRAIHDLDFRKYDDMPLKVRYAQHPRRYDGSSHRISSEGSKLESPNQGSTMSLAENISPRESKSRDVASPSLGRRHGDPTRNSTSEQSKPPAKSKLRNGKAIETPNTVSESSSRHRHRTSFSSAPNVTVVSHSREVSESSNVAVTMNKERKVAEHSPRLSQSPENILSSEKGREIPQEISAVNENPLGSSTAEREIKVAENSSSMVKQEAKVAESSSSTAEREIRVAENSSSMVEQEAKVAESSSSTAEREIRVAENSSSMVEQEAKVAEFSSSAIEQGVMAAKDSSILSDNLQKNSEIEQKAVMDVSKEHKSAEHGQGSGALANAPTMDSRIQSHNQTLPQNITETDSVLATEPQANRDANASISSLAAEDDSVLSRRSHKFKWKLQQRAAKAAKQKKMLEKEQQKLGAKDAGVLVETGEESILSDIKSEENDPSVSENVHAETAEQQIQLETDLQSSLDEKSQSETIGPTESSIAMQNHIAVASKSAAAPEILPMGVNETSSADWPSLPKRVEVDGTKASPLPETPSVTQQMKKKKKKQKNSTAVSKDVETSCKPEPNPIVTEKATDIETLPDQVHGECATDIKGDGDGNSGISINEEATERKRESTEPLRTESITPTPNHPDSTTAQPQNTKSKKARKSKGKKKGKSAEESSRAPACPSEEVAEALVALSKGVVQASAVPSEESAEAKASLKRYLPAPETPFLTEQMQNVLPVEIDEKEKDQTHIAPPIGSDDKGEGHTNTIVPVETNKKRKGRKTNKSTFTAEKPHICSRKELSRYHFLKDRDYWPQISKIIRGHSIPGLNSSAEPMPENLQNSEAGEPGVSHSQPKNSVEANSAVSMKESIEGTMAEEKLADPGSETVAKPKSLDLESAHDHDSSASGTNELSVPNPNAISEHASLPSALSSIHQSVADLESPSKSVKAFSEAVVPSNTPLLTPQTPYTRTGTESSSSLGNFSDDDSSESSTLQSDGDDSTDNGGEDPPTVVAEDVSPSSRQNRIRPFHHSDKPSGRILPPDWQPGDRLQVKTTADGKSIVMRISQDEQKEEEVSNMEDEEEEKERDHVERRDNAVMVEKEPWGYQQKVWID